MRILHVLTMLITFVGCITEKRERCYEPDGLDRPSEPHLIYDEATNTCVRVDGVDSSTGDASVDATPDAEPECSASKACSSASRPVCKEGSCVSCDDNASPNEACAALSAETPVCEPVSGACVACIDNTTCTDATASKCDASNNTCTTCEDGTEGADATCSHIEGLPFCIDGECKACESDADCPDGEGGTFVCNVLIGACTDRAPKSREYCQTCVSTTDCQFGSCVEFDYKGAKDFYCLPNNNDGCKVNGYPTGLSDAHLIGTETMNDVCRPFAASCEAVRDVNKPCTLPEALGVDPEGCGRTDVGDAAYCVGKSDDTTACSIGCPPVSASAADCLGGVDCIAPRQRSELGEMGVKVCDF